MKKKGKRKWKAWNTYDGKRRKRCFLPSQRSQIKYRAQENNFPTINVCWMFQDSITKHTRTPFVHHMLPANCSQLHVFDSFFSYFCHRCNTLFYKFRQLTSKKKHAFDVLYVKRFMEHTWYNVCHQIHEYIRNQWRRNYKWNFVYGQQPFFFYLNYHNLHFIFE